MSNRIGVSRYTAERIQACLEAHSYVESTKLANELRALLATPAVARQEPNQCDGCRAGKPLENGNRHRMGRDGGYPDFMSCTAKLYTSPPAPVSVMLPTDDHAEEAFENSKFHGHDVFFAGFYACLDKVKELNP